jgi:outer membrane protein
MKYALKLIVALFVIMCFQYDALGADAPKIGVVDIQKLQNRSKTFQKTRAELKKKFDAMQAKLDQEKAALVKLEEEFRKQSMMLSLDAKEDKKRELEKKSRFYKYLFEDFTQQMKDLEIEATKRIGKELEKIVKEIGEKEGYSLILEKRTLGLLYFSSAVDITDQVTKRYDKNRK